jgi:ATP-dependent DNA helicase RecG
LDLATPLQYVKGIGPARAEMLAAKGLQTVSDLLFYAPFRYEDRRNVKRIHELAPGEKAVVLGAVVTAKAAGFKRRRLGLFEVCFSDGSGENLEARWFHGERYADTLIPGRRVALFGKVELSRSTGRRLMIQPEIEILGEREEDELLHTGRVVAVYEAAGKVSTRVFRLLLHRVLDEAPMPEDPLPRSVRERIELPDLAPAIRQLHAPDAAAKVEQLNEFRSPAQVRIIFDEFFWLECGLALKKNKARKATGISFAVNESVRGIGVAVITKTSGSAAFLNRSNRCRTPKRCCSSTIARPNLANETSSWISACVPTTAWIIPSEIMRLICCFSLELAEPVS